LRTRRIGRQNYAQCFEACLENGGISSKNGVKTVLSAFLTVGFRTDGAGTPSHTPSEFLKRHICGDWGKLDTHDTKANDSAMKTGLRLLSSYEMKGGEMLWVITEAVDIERGDNPKQRQLTTLLLPSEY
jgi:hypothetical protein